MPTVRGCPSTSGLPGDEARKQKCSNCEAQRPSICIGCTGAKLGQQRRKQYPGLYVPIGRSEAGKTYAAAAGTTVEPAAKSRTPKLKVHIKKASTDGYVVTLIATVQQRMTVLKTAEIEDERFPSL